MADQFAALGVDRSGRLRRGGARFRGHAPLATIALAGRGLAAGRQTPFPVEEGHIAPAFVGVFFPRFLEEAANPRPPLALLLLATVLVLVLVIYGVASLIAWGTGRRRRRSKS